MNFSALPRDTVLGSALRALLRVLPPNATVPVLQGRLRGYRWIVGSGVHGYWLGSYEYTKRKLFEAIVPRGGLVFDVGANVGYYTLLAAQLVGPAGTVVAFEPLPRNLRYLEAHLRLNRVRNVRVSRTAVWDYSGVVKFNSGPNGSQGSASQSGEFDVPATSLDDFVAVNSLPAPDVIKMDIEGGELHALNGASRILAEGSPTILLATHGATVHKACCSLLASHKYQLRSVNGDLPVDATDEIIARK